MKKEGECTILYPAYCMQCVHCEGPLEKGTKIGCLAYPSGIPDKIIEGVVKHEEPRTGQEGEYVYTEV